MKQNRFLRATLAYGLATVAFTLLLVGRVLQAKATKIEMTPEHWAFPPGKVEFVQYHGNDAMKISPGTSPVSLKEMVFTNGIIEFDVEPSQPDFVSFYFRRQNTDEGELVYLRTWNAGKPTAPDTLQYAPMVKSVNLWDLLGHFQAACDLRSNNWNHVKLVVSGAQLRVFVNDTAKPVLEVPQLEGDVTSGELAFQGAAYFANLRVIPGEVEGLSAAEGIDPTSNDPRYLRRWKVSKPMELPPGRELFRGELPRPDAAWEPIDAERRGLVNITRRFGKNEVRKAVWLKVNLRVAREQLRHLELGFSDEVWVFLNGGLAFVDKNLYLQPLRKPPNGRCSLENATVNLTLKAGDNELLMGVANDFYGWGIVARFDDLDGVEVLGAK
ncbi:MAG TPA: hypothetical protein VMF06_21980 [Candidatus Limnocylindria bacterium]|nr:hypothetical protein [Candidatus Limnocylindria bacterium]